MRIAQVSPLYISVPPKFYGGVERVISYLTEELLQYGHKVTLFASGDSVTNANLMSFCEKSLWSSYPCSDTLIFHYSMLETLIQQASCFDIIHFHTDYIHFPFLRRLLVPSLTTLHSSLDESGKLFGFYRDTPVVSISNSQRNALPFMNWQETIYHGLPIDLFSFRGEQGKYLAFLGSISPEKGIEEAIIIAMRSDIPIKIAARVSSANREYFETTIAPLLKHPSVEFLGEIGDSEKNEFLGQAYALLFPINWAEPFGLVMIEAMACGTPVIAYARGAVPEIIEHGVNGFIVNDIDDAVRVIKQAGRLNRRRCRQIFEERFHVSFMTTRYLSVYERLIYKNLDVDN